MRLADLPADVLDQIRKWRYDSIIEKHEGPGRWEWVLEDYNPEFLDINGHSVLLPLERDEHPKIQILRTIPSRDGQALTIFLKNTRFGDEWHSAGFLAVCEKFPGQQFFLATVYHEWFIVENP